MVRGLRLLQELHLKDVMVHLQVDQHPQQVLEQASVHALVTPDRVQRAAGEQDHRGPKGNGASTDHVTMCVCRSNMQEALQGINPFNYAAKKYKVQIRQAS